MYETFFNIFIKHFQYYKWYNKAMTLKEICKKAIEQNYVIDELPSQLRAMMY